MRQTTVAYLIVAASTAAAIIIGLKTGTKAQVSPDSVPDELFFEDFLNSVDESMESDNQQDTVSLNDQEPNEPIEENTDGTSSGRILPSGNQNQNSVNTPSAGTPVFYRNGKIVNVAPVSVKKETEPDGSGSIVTETQTGTVVTGDSSALSGAEAANENTLKPAAEAAEAAPETVTGKPQLLDKTKLIIASLAALIVIILITAVIVFIKKRSKTRGEKEPTLEEIEEKSELPVAMQNNAGRLEQAVAAMKEEVAVNDDEDNKSAKQNEDSAQGADREKKF